ncbi:MAG: acyltransferase family protein, partial [Terriglobales bacterium]
TWFVALSPHLTKAGAFWFHNSGDCLIPMAIFITVLAMERGVLSKFFASKPMAILGDMSFALYMLHAVFIAYFNTHFHEEYLLYPALFFFGGLLIAAHIMHTSIVQPMRFQVLKWGTKVIELKYPAPPKPPKRQKTAAQIRNKRIILAGEIAACATLMYFAFPTIHRISPAEAAVLSTQATTHDVQFDPWLSCKSGLARATRGQVIADGQTIATQQVTVDTVWQALKSEPVDFYITARVLDDQGKLLALSRYQMDGRFQHVAAGNCWKDMVHISVDSNVTPAKVAIKITRGRRKELAAHCDVPAQIQGKEMIIPVGL